MFAQNLSDLNLLGFSGSLLVHCPNTKDQKIEFGVEPDLVRSYLIASVSKILTGFRFWSLEQQGKVDINQPISDFIEIPKRFESVCLLDLLTHQSGLTDKVERSDFGDIDTIKFPEKTFQRYFKLHGDLQSGFSYSNTGYSLLAYIGEVITNCSHDDYLKNFFQGLMLENTKLVTDDSVDKNIFTTFPYDWLGYKGADGVVTSIEDLNKLCNYIVTQIASCFSELKDCRKIGLTDISQTYYGYGWNFEVDSFGNLKSIWVSGASWPEGFMSYFKYIPNDSRSISLLSDSPSAAAAFEAILKKIVVY